MKQFAYIDSGGYYDQPLPTEGAHDVFSQLIFITNSHGIIKANIHKRFLAGDKTSISQP